MSIEISANYCGNSSLGEVYHPKIWTVEKQHRIYVDVGAYNGRTTRDTLLAYPQLIAVAIDPLKINFQEMKKTLSDMKGRVHIINKGCWHNKGTLPIRFRRDKPGVSTLIEKNVTARHKEVINIEVDTLDKILSDIGVSHVDFLKIDTEGAEHNVLKGFTKTRGNTRFHIEYHNNLGLILEQLLIKNAADVKVFVGRGGFGGSIMGRI